VTEALGGALGDPAIRRIEFAWTAGVVADWAYQVALLVVAYRVAGALGVGVLGLVRMLPAMILGPFAAMPVRGLRGARALVAVHAVRAGAALLTVLALSADGPAPLTYALAAVVAGAGALVRPRSFRASRGPRVSSWRRTWRPAPARASAPSSDPSWAAS
jgi:hypothetical protein